jgi:bacterioferritin-associated ferredoxin
MSAPSPSFLRQFPDSPAETPRKVVCHCLNICESTIESKIEAGRVGTVKEVIRETGAGSGCTACHCTIRALLEAAGRSVTCAVPHRFALSPEPAAVAG